MTRLAVIKKANRFNGFNDEITRLGYIDDYCITHVYSMSKGIFYERPLDQAFSLGIQTELNTKYNRLYYLEYTDDSIYNGSCTYSEIRDLDSGWSFKISKQTLVSDFKNIEGEFSRLVHNHNIECSLANL